MIEPSKGGSSPNDLSQLFMNNQATQPTAVPTITQPMAQPLPSLGSLAPQPMPRQQAGPPAGWEDVSGNPLFFPGGMSQSAQEFGPPAPNFGPGAASFDWSAHEPFKMPQGTLKSVHGNNYLLPGTPGHPGAMQGAPAQPQMSQAQLLARAMNAQAR